MKKRQLGKTEIRVSEIGMGTWQLGGIGWSLSDNAVFAKALETARNAGITFFDTAPVYGFGRSEELLGDVLGSDSEAVFATKCGLVWDDSRRVKHDLSFDSILFQVDDSLKRLKRDHIHLFQIHWPDVSVDLEESFQALNQLVDEKVISAIGVSNFTIRELKKAASLTKNLESIQPLYNMFTRGSEKELFPFCEEQKLSVFPYSPFCQGLLSGAVKKDFVLTRKDARNSNINFTDTERFQRNLERVEKLTSIAKQAEVSMHELNVLWLLSHKQISSVIGGSTNPQHIAETAAVAGKAIAPETLKAIEGVIDADELQEGVSFNY